MKKLAPWLLVLLLAGGSAWAVDPPAAGSPWGMLETLRDRTFCYRAQGYFQCNRYVRTATGMALFTWDGRPVNRLPITIGRNGVLEQVGVGYTTYITLQGPNAAILRYQANGARMETLQTFDGTALRRTIVRINGQPRSDTSLRFDPATPSEVAGMDAAIRGAASAPAKP